MSRPIRRSVLLLDPDPSRAQTYSTLLEREVPFLEAHHLAVPEEADLFLQTARFDAIVAHRTPAVMSWLIRQARPAPTLLIVGDVGEAGTPEGEGTIEWCPRQDSPGATCADLAVRLRHRWEAVRGNGMTTRDGAVHTSSAPDDVLDAVEAAASRLKHDINNPLSIIAGNAQLLLELASMHQLDGDVVQAVRDIQNAAAQASKLASQLKDLREQVTQKALDEGDA
jgi:signal transduction histidine kinase